MGSLRFIADQENMFNALTDMLHEILRSIKQIPQESSSSFQLERMILRNHGWLHMCDECFVPLPPFVAIWKEGEYPIPCIKSTDVSGNEPDMVIGTLLPHNSVIAFSWGLIGVRGMSLTASGVEPHLSEYMEDRLSRRSVAAFSEFNTTRCVPKSSAWTISDPECRIKVKPTPLIRVIMHSPVSRPHLSYVTH